MQYINLLAKTEAQRDRLAVALTELRAVTRDIILPLVATDAECWMAEMTRCEAAFRATDAVLAEVEESNARHDG